MHPLAAQAMQPGTQSGAAFISVGKTRPEVPTKVSMPRPCIQSRSAVGLNAASQGASCPARAP